MNAADSRDDRNALATAQGMTSRQAWRYLLAAERWQLDFRREVFRHVLARVNGGLA